MSLAWPQIASLSCCCTHTAVKPCTLFNSEVELLYMDFMSQAQIDGLKLCSPTPSTQVISTVCSADGQRQEGVGATPGSWQKGTALGYLALSCEVVTALLKP